jgi:hypothetical protein
MNFDVEAPLHPKHKSSLVDLINIAEMPAFVEDLCCSIGKMTIVHLSTFIYVLWSRKVLLNFLLNLQNQPILAPPFLHVVVDALTWMIKGAGLHFPLLWRFSLL